MPRSVLVFLWTWAERQIQLTGYYTTQVNIMSAFQITPVDHEKEEEGAWGTYLGVPLLIARANNDKFKKIFRRLSKPHQKAIDKNRLDDATAKDIMVKSVAGGILNGWDKEKIPGNREYTRANAELLLDTDPDCMDYVQEFAADLDNYIKDDINETVKEF